MNQRKIMALLHEAAILKQADSKRFVRRINEIHVLLSDAVYRDRHEGQHEGQDALLSRPAALRTLLDHLYVETLQSAPAQLPALFPVFALLCGDRDGTILNAIDWTILREDAPSGDSHE